MKTLLCKAFGQPDTLTVEDVPSPKVRGGEVKVRVHAAGVNFPDVLMVQGLYQMKPDFPFSPGLEVAGEVLEVGTGVEHLKVGDKVIGMVNYGGFAEEVCVPAMMTLPMPKSMSYAEAAGFPIVYGTSHLALWHRANLQAGETLLVLGAAGGVGLTAVEIGKLMGATVIAAASTPEKLALAQSYGADYGIQYTSEDLRERVKQVTEGRFVDVVYDPVGGEIFEQAVRCMAWEGRYLVIGFASGKIPEIAINRMLIKNTALVGVFWGAYAINKPQVMQQSFRQLMTWVAEGKLKPHISQTFSLEDAPQALLTLANRQAQGKLVIRL